MKNILLIEQLLEESENYSQQEDKVDKLVSDTLAGDSKNRLSLSLKFINTI